MNKPVFVAGFFAVVGFFAVEDDTERYHERKKKQSLLRQTFLGNSFFRGLFGRGRC